MRAAVAAGALVLSCVVAGCSASPPAAPTEPVGSVAASAAPTSEAASSPSPAPPVKPTKAEDKASLKKLLVGASDLGKPWTQPKSVSQVKGKKGEICPGHTSAVDDVRVTAGTAANFTEGGGVGKNIATFSLTALADDGDETLAAAYAKDQRSCARYHDGSGLYVVRTTEGPASVTGAELVTSWAERIYYDKQHTKLAYARHTLVARQGRLVTYLSYAFLTTKKDPRAKDFARATRLLEVQVTKNAGGLV